MNPNTGAMPNTSQPGANPNAAPQAGQDTGSKKKKSKLALEGQNKTYAMIFMSVLLALVGYFYYGGVASEVKLLNDNILKLNTEKSSVAAFKDPTKQQEIVSAFPLYYDSENDFLEKQDADTAIEIRDYAQKNQLSISGYETGISDSSMTAWVSLSAAVADIPEPTLVIPSMRRSSFIIAGDYKNMVNFLQELEGVKRFVVVSDLSFSGSVAASDDDEEGNVDFFVEYDNINSARVEVAYYYLKSSLAPSSNNSSGGNGGEAINSTSGGTGNTTQNDDSTTATNDRRSIINEE